MKKNLETFAIFALLILSGAGLYWCWTEIAKMDRGCSICHRIDSHGVDYYVRECGSGV
jgi:hypothetical protein